MSEIVVTRHQFIDQLVNDPAVDVFIRATRERCQVVAINQQGTSFVLGTRDGHARNFSHPQSAFDFFRQINCNSFNVELVEAA
ncbi:hypothetical protein [Nissabacter sp. SGAir0207]|uniref:hypothetical protein n=1 Tax=Nissabacter sp. SGAir0207 TaxID=2126321 RepID=UPI0010CCCC45|nr:hypothetical protein [Nissabacter sp. SGAir0207]QCR38748.1 hypothetical protein C1N62_21695 [Nissabacter sp. SGAir0207]